MNTYVKIQTLLLMVVFVVWTLISAIYNSKEIVVWVPKLIDIFMTFYKFGS